MPRDAKIPMSMILRRQLASTIAAATTLLLIAGACDWDRSSHSRRSSDRLMVRIAVVTEGKDEPTWQIITSAARRFEELYPYAKFEVVAPENPTPTEQQAVLEGFLQAEANVICVIPIDAMAAGVVIDRLVKAGRPVVTIWRDSPESSRAVFCGPAESQIGRSAAEACRLALPKGTRTAMILHGGEGRAAYQGRYYAFKATIPTLGNIHVLREVDCQGIPVEAVRLVRAQSRLYPRLGCWVLLEDWPLRALRPSDRLLPLGIGMVLCNGSPKYFARMRSGEVSAMITFDYLDAVENGFRAALRLAEGDSRESAPIVASPTEIITIRELDDYERRWKGWQQGRPTPKKSPR